MVLLEARNVSYAYMKDHLVLRNVNVQMERGKMYCIYGPSGCGKTTLLSLLGGLDAPTEGEILFAGRSISEIGLDEHRRRNAAFIFQNYNLIDYMTPIENVQMTTRKNPRQFLEQVGLRRNEMTRSVLKLSGGQQQRVAIARALASGAALILADEPTGNLDEYTAMEIIQLLKRNAHEMNKCVVIVSHSNLVADEADVVFRLHYGILREG